MIDYKALRDPHLNLFWQYGGEKDNVSRLENNITKAFINLLDGSSQKEKTRLCNALFKTDLPASKLRFEFYLQKKPDPSLVSSFPERKRLLFAFCPTGKLRSKKKEGIEEDKASEEAILQVLRKVSGRSKGSIGKKSRKGDSIPDAWIFIYQGKTPLYVIILENKLRNLDPKQLDNHVEKSLYLKSDSVQPIFCSYKNLIQAIKPLHTYLSEQFVEYFILLGQDEVDDFHSAFLADRKLIPTTAYAFGEEIAKRVHPGEVNQRRGHMWRIEVDYPYLHEINFAYEDDGVRLSLAFGPNQTLGEKMLKAIECPRIEDAHLKELKQTFHLLDNFGRALKETYFEDDVPLEGFVSYLKKSFLPIKRGSSEEAISFYRKMRDEGFLTASSYRRIASYLKGKKGGFSFSPEISCDFFYPYEEIASMGLEGFSNECKEAIHKSLLAFDLKPGDGL